MYVFATVMADARVPAFLGARFRGRDGKRTRHLRELFKTAAATNVNPIHIGS